MTLRRSSWLRAALLCCALIAPAIGCGDDTSDDDTDGGAGDSGSGGKGGTGGKGGSGGKGGTGGKGGSGGAGGSGSTLKCGGSECKINDTLAMISQTAKACCTSDNKCGQTNSAGDCKQQNAPGELDSTCPTVDVEFGGMNYPQMGCCTPSGKCGGFFMQVGYGCLPREELQSDQGGPLEAKSCGNGGGGSGGAGGSSGGSGGTGGSGGNGNDQDAGPDAG